MKASERLAERNELLEVISQIDDDLKGLKADKSFRAAQQAREMLDTCHQLCREINKLGFTAPELDERYRDGEGNRPGARFASPGGSDSAGENVVAKRRIGSASQGSVSAFGGAQGEGA